MQKFNFSGLFLAEWGGQGIGDSEFNDPSGIAVAEDGSIYVADTRNNRIQKFGLPYAKGEFSIDVIDTRPTIWLQTFERLSKDREFAENRYQRAETVYDRIIENADASPEEIDNAEGFYRRAFEQKSQADRFYDEFKAFLASEGIDVAGDSEEISANLEGRITAQRGVTSEFLQSIETAETDPDVRQYRYLNGEYIDQYGVPLYEHIIDIGGATDPDRETVLIVPIVEDPDVEEQPSQLLIIRNPVFSGTQIHPPTFLFEERFALDVAWKGIGLGEFSHSINLFPGEERELEITTTKKRSWETVSKTTEITKTGRTSEAATSSKRTDSFEEKLHDSFETSKSFKKDDSKSSSMKLGISGPMGVATGSANFSADSKSSSSKSTSSVAKKARDITSRTSTEVSQSNKVSFSSSTEAQRSLEEKRLGEDTESETQTIHISNINEGRTINYNFYQVMNVYQTNLWVEDVKLHISTGVEIIPGTGLTIAKTYEIEDFIAILRDFRIYSESDRREIVKAIAAQIFKRYMYLEEDEIEDDPQVVKVRDGNKRELRALRNDSREIVFDEAQFDAASDPATFRQPFDAELLELAELKLYVERLKVEAGDTYTINSGKYYVDAHLGLMPAMDEYLEARRDIETDRQQALNEELSARTQAGVFFPELPEGVTTLSLDRERIGSVGGNTEEEEDQAPVA